MRESAVPWVAGLILWMAVVGCAGSGGNAVAPDTDVRGLSSMGQTAGSDTHLWGYYDVYFDPETEEIEAVPNREAMFAANVVTFLNGKPASLQFHIVSTTSGSGYIDIDINVGITHPFAGLPQYNGYDVRGIFIGDKSDVLDYGSNLGYAVSGSDQYLTNADGYTRWFNPGEFIYPGLMGYTPGNFATRGYKGSATVNPYKYYADGLNPAGGLWQFLTSTSGHGVFASGRTNTRNYKIRFPNSTGIRYNYSVVANWVNESTHPANAPEAVGCNIVNNSTVYYENSSKKGGNIILDISLFGWNYQPSKIFIQSTVLSSLYQLTPGEMVPTATGEHYATYHVEIPADNVGGTQGNEFWVIAQYDNFNYKCNLTPPGPGAAPNAPLAAFFRHGLPVSSQEPAWIEVLTPNGGEEWNPGTDETISWDSNLPGSITVLIEYSKDDFQSDINTIAVYEPNDGTYLWEDIPCEICDTVKVRISQTTAPDVFDTSDDYFKIVGTGWCRTWGGTNAESMYSVGTAGDGSIFVGGVIGTVSNLVAALTKITPCNEIEWTKQWSGNQSVYLFGVAADNSGNGYATGMFEGTVDFDPGPGVESRTSYDARDGYLSKFDSSGDFQWVVVISGGGDWCGYSIKCDDAGNIYWGGQESYEAFLRKETSSGANIWQIWWGPSAMGRGIALDGSGGVYETGYFSTTVDFDPGPEVHERTPIGGGDVFLAKYSAPTGSFQKVTSFGGSSFDRGWGVAVDSSGNIYVTGEFSSVVDFDPGPGQYILTSNGGRDGFLTMFDSDWNHQWAISWGYVSDDFGYDVVVDQDDYCYVCGVLHFITAEVDDALLRKYDSSGDMYLEYIVGSSGEDEAHGLSIDPSNNVFLTGWFTTVVEFAPTGAPCYEGSDPHTSNGQTDAFVVKYLSDGCW